MSLLIALKAFGGTLFSPGALSFSNFVNAAFSASQDMGLSSLCMPFLCMTSSSVVYLTGQLAQNTLAKCVPRTEVFSTSVVAVFPSGNHIVVMIGFSDGFFPHQTEY